jgi:glycerol-3-phosphate dehydrogenase
VRAERESQSQPTDESADALRASAPEARSGIIEPVS